MLPAPRRIRRLLFSLIALAVAPGGVRAQCDEAPPLANFTGAGQVVCLCFVAGEEAGAVLTPPPADLPIEVLRVGIGWGSQFGGTPQSLEAAVKIYGDGLPNPGAPIASLGGPVMTDGFVNEFDLEATIGAVPVTGPDFTVTLEFLNDNANDFFAPTIVHDGNGCTPTRNVVKAIPGGWFDACALGVSGDWVVYAVYRPQNCATGVEEVVVATGGSVVGAAPNPFRGQTQIQFVLERSGPAEVAVYDATGRLVNRLARRDFTAGLHTLEWDGRSAAGVRAAAGTYFVRLSAGEVRSTHRIVHLR